MGRRLLASRVEGLVCAQARLRHAVQVSQEPQALTEHARKWRTRELRVGRNYGSRGGGRGNEKVWGMKCRGERGGGV